MQTQTRLQACETATPVRQASQGLLVFGSLLAPLSLLGYGFYYLARDSAPILPSLPLMLAPGLAVVITRLVLREGFADVSFRLGGRGSLRAIGLALAVPLIVGGLAYGAAYLTGLARFAPPTLPLLPPTAGPLANFVLLIMLDGTLGALVLLPGTAGEEIGWRGYLLPRLIQAGAPRPILLTGLIWGAWHLVPLFVVGYAAGPALLFSAVNLIIAATAFSYILAWMRLDTGSLWPCVVAHAAWNAIINDGFDLATQGEAAKLWVGESGFLVMLVLVFVTLVIGRTRHRA